MESMRLPCSFDVSATYLVICDIDFLRHLDGIELDKFSGGNRQAYGGKKYIYIKRSNSRGDGKKSWVGRG